MNSGLPCQLSEISGPPYKSTTNNLPAPRNLHMAPLQRSYAFLSHTWGFRIANDHEDVPTEPGMGDG